jgi:hypothetical protein
MIHRACAVGIVVVAAQLWAGAAARVADAIARTAIGEPVGGVGGLTCT